MLLPFFAIALLIAPPHAARRTPPPCHTLTDAQFRQPLILTEPCYIINTFASVSAPLTINPGTTISFGEDSALSFENGGFINAVGTADKPIVLRGREHAPGYWTGLRIGSNSPRNHLSYVTVEDAGQKGSSDEGAVQVGVGARLSIDHTTIRNAASVGLNVLQRGTLSHFEANHFEGDNIPLSIKAGDAAALDAATTFANNAHNYVLIHFNDAEIEEDATWHALAVPYRLEGTPEIKAHLTIEPGARLEFHEGFGINVNENGSLTAEGTATHPITFTGGEEAPGFWDGIYFQSKSPKNILRNTVIKYAGTKGGLANAAVALAPGAAATVQSSEIAFSATAAIRVMQNAQLNTDAAATNRMHDNAAGIVQEQ
ncbi:MAG: hypothetical protein BGO25_15140 [Acidobacteriales bacterium 59-55]|nr:hypothetical protein [Terriglobales bacterium]OJV41097.1 MAG: hypothetical protein BGO25_15140 [Acidobacteriales bacterium 59-55]